MSYINGTESIGADNIRFYYTTKGIFDEVSLRTHYRARTIQDQAGKSQIANFAISDDEADAVNVFLGYAMNKVFSEVVKLTKGIQDSLFVNVNISGPPNVAASGFSIIDNDNYNLNVLNLVDVNIRECIIHYILKEWYRLCGHEAERLVSEKDYTSGITDMCNSLFELRKKLIGN